MSFVVARMQKMKSGNLVGVGNHTQLVACRRQPCIWSIKGTRQSKTLSRNLILN